MVFSALFTCKAILFIERLNVKIVGTGSITGVLGEAEKERVEQLQNENKKFVTIPRRYYNSFQN